MSTVESLQNSIPIQQPASLTTPAQEHDIWSYVVIGVCVLCVCLVVWYAYCKWQENTDEFVAGNRQERDDPVIDFNLRDVLTELERLQNKVLKNVSQDTGI